MIWAPWPSRGPKRAIKWLTMGSRRPTTAPRRHKMAPRRPKNHPRRPKRAPRGAPIAPPQTQIVDCL
eukprot:5753055-Pyramimonas_sp.AAC.1